MSLQQAFVESQRLAVLLALGEADDSRLAEGVLRRAVSTLVKPVSPVELRALLTWLEQAGLVRLEKLPQQDGEKLWRAILTPDGHLVRKGRAHDGVERVELA